MEENTDEMTAEEVEQMDKGFDDLRFKNVNGKRVWFIKKEEKD